MTIEEYARKLIELRDSIIQSANRSYEAHARREAGKRNQPHLHEANGKIHASNLVGEFFNKEIPEDARKKLADEWRVKQANLDQPKC